MGWKILQRQDAEGRIRPQRAELAAALGVPLGEPAVDVLLGAMVRPEFGGGGGVAARHPARMVEEMTPAERDAIEGLAALRKPLRPESADQITWRCLLAPPPAVYEAGRAVLWHRMAAPPPAALEGSRTRLLQAVRRYRTRRPGLPAGACHLARGTGRPPSARSGALDAET